VKPTALIPLLCWLLGTAAVLGAPSWEEALRAMPLPTDAPLLNRDNAVSVLLHAFRSNDTVKALLVLPEVADDFYLINRDKPRLDLRATNLLDALTKLTNATALRLTWNKPLLLVHLAGDRLEPSIVVEDAATADLLKQQPALKQGVFVDTHWERLQPRLAADLQRKVRPAPDSQDAWHFARHNFAAWNLTGWELLSAGSLAGNTTVTVQKSSIVFKERSSR
jgi:hypothetical protein